MGKVNRGKSFEEAIRVAFERNPDVSVTRLLDPQAGYAGVRNICDFIVYSYPRQYFIECKSCHGNTLPIYSTDPKKCYGAITNTQWEGLVEQSSIKGVVAGYLIWFIDHDVTIFVSALKMKELRDKGDKSFNITKRDDKDLFRIDGRKKRVLFEYDMTNFFNEFSKNC